MSKHYHIDLNLVEHELDEDHDQEKTLVELRKAYIPSLSEAKRMLDRGCTAIDDGFKFPRSWIRPGELDTPR